VPLPASGIRISCVFLRSGIGHECRDTPPFCAREVGPSESAEAREGGKGEVVFVTLGAQLPHRIIPFEKRDAPRLGYRIEIQRTKGRHPSPSTLGDYFAENFHSVILAPSRERAAGERRRDAAAKSATRLSINFYDALFALPSASLVSSFFPCRWMLWKLSRLGDKKRAKLHKLVQTVGRGGWLRGRNAPFELCRADLPTRLTRESVEIKKNAAGGRLVATCVLHVLSTRTFNSKSHRASLALIGDSKGSRRAVAFMRAS